MVAVLISRILEAVMPVLSRMMLLGALGAASGSAGFILERYWSSLAALFSFAEEALAFVLTNVNKFLSTGILVSIIFCRRIYVFLVLLCLLPFFHCLQNLRFFSFGWLMQRTAASCFSVGLLFRIVASPLIALQWSVGFCQQPQVKFLS